jgi:hypothetical protein
LNAGVVALHQALEELNELDDHEHGFVLLVACKLRIG